MPHIFERYAKDDDFGQGGGIGLSISHKIAEELGGEIGAESEKDKGSRFWLRIPKDVPFDDTPS
jgi:signal transduction histidine kinase